jgi:ADP-ribose pyrophosphatase YjhB (NUDIX family)
MTARLTAYLAAVALFDSGGNILLSRRKDNDKWTMPGDTLDFGKSLTHCAIRLL